MIDAVAASRSALPTAEVPATSDGGKPFITVASRWGPTAPVLLCGGSSGPNVLLFDTQLMQDYRRANSPSSVFTVLDVDLAATSNDPNAAGNTGFAAAEALVRADAIATGNRCRRFASVP